ncbi:hypothetical protein LTR10_020907 [Elasticomyces elasticus]|uniref:Uncharacterized protein n=1 Tax=Exophiala sideris TaxID=1016849 RepID=A0ABR0J1M6_9EURO|nr:hypothetical protein LTR10_020907 [Elasticomyces elasticus]KAK5023381.1 hypothetical protein LTS07_009256 [Exophiala sideris]KAK5028244.1 hypothetical protein LTR13_009232 [Exophiala sideris]KAK5052902.1 hypothetical protein LTR69_009728 [Exophiala sideris]KAK5178513.1 hypothetical protein LTR44_009138 [Eurotiomycetes sp. CCFEE 6388]
MENLKAKTVIITGAASGIGLATAISLLRAGAKVLALDISVAPPILASYPPSHYKFRQIDLSKRTSAKEIVETCIETFGNTIDALLNVAGVMDNNNSADALDAAMWDRVIAINLTAPMLLTKEVVQVMLKHGKGGSIVNIANWGHKEYRVEVSYRRNSV